MKPVSSIAETSLLNYQVDKKLSKVYSEILSWVVDIALNAEPAASDLGGSRATGSATESSAIAESSTPIHSGKTLGPELKENNHV